MTTEEEAIAFINEIRAQHREASHNVYAYALREGQVRRYSDDGEPQGTAGIPVLDVLQKSGIVDAVVVVTRISAAPCWEPADWCVPIPRALPLRSGQPVPG